MFANDNEEALELIDNNVRDGDVLLAIGAGNIGELPARLMKKKVNK